MSKTTTKKSVTKVTEAATATANATAGKTKSTKRAERIAQASPYQTKNGRKGEDVEDEEMEQDASIGCRVFVTNLSWTTKADELKEHMKAAGPVKLAIVLGSGNHSSGNGVVTYANEEAAKNAIATLQESKLDGRPIFVREDRKAPLAERAPEPRPVRRERKGKEEEDVEMEDTSMGCRVFITNLSWKTKSEGLKEHMKAAGPVQSATVLVTNGRSTGCGVVTFETEEAAKNAIATLLDSELDGRKIFIREDRQAPPKRTRGTRVYVGNLDWSIKWQELKDHMNKAGTVLYADILEASAGRSKGCGLVEYATERDAARAIKEMHDTELGGRLIFVREDRVPEGGSISQLARRAPGSRDEKNRQLYVGNLPHDTNWQKLKDLFGAIGDVERADVVEGSDGRPRGFGIVRYSTAADAAQAIERLNRTEVEGRVITVRLDKKE